MSAEQFMALHGELVQVKYNRQTGVSVRVCPHQFPVFLASKSLRMFGNAGRGVTVLRIKS